MTNLRKRFEEETGWHFEIDGVPQLGYWKEYAAWLESELSVLREKDNLLLRLATYIVKRHALSHTERYDAMQDAKRVVKDAEVMSRTLKGEGNG